MFRSARVIALFVCLVLAGWVRAGDIVPEARLKAGFVANFMQFVRWPGNPAQLTLCGFGSAIDGDTLTHLKDFKVGHLSLKARRIADLHDIGACQAIFVDTPHSLLLQSLLDASRGRSILLITEFESGAPLGAMFSLVPAGAGRLGFDVNLTASQAAGLTINSRLLQLARRVY